MIGPTKEFFVRLKAAIDCLSGKPTYIPRALTPREAGFNGGSLPYSATPILERDAFRRRWLSHVRYFSQVLQPIEIEVTRPLQVIEEPPPEMLGVGTLVCTSIKTVMNAIGIALGWVKKRVDGHHGAQGSVFRQIQHSEIMFDDPNLPIKALMAEVLASIMLDHQARQAGYRVTFTTDPTMIGSGAAVFNSLHLAVRQIGIARCHLNKSTPVGNQVLVIRPTDHPLAAEHREFSAALTKTLRKVWPHGQAQPVWTPASVAANPSLFQEAIDLTASPTAPYNWMSMQLWPKVDYAEGGRVLRQWFLGWYAHRALVSMERHGLRATMISRDTWRQGVDPAMSRRHTPFIGVQSMMNGVVGCYCPRCASIDEVQAIMPSIPDDALKGGPQFLEQHVGTIYDMPGVYGVDFIKELGIDKPINIVRYLALDHKSIITNYVETWA